MGPWGFLRALGASLLAPSPLQLEPVPFFISGFILSLFAKADPIKSSHTQHSLNRTLKLLCGLFYDVNIWLYQVFFSHEQFCTCS